MAEQYDYAIIGAGVIGLCVAKALKKRNPNYKIAIFEKESSEAQHGSGRNSGVLHAGFYYTADSLKAKFTAEGNQRMREYCQGKGIALNECGKLVVAKDASELRGLEELKRRGDVNGVATEWLSTAQAEKLEPNVKSYESVLYSPKTASLDPRQVCHALKEELNSQGVDFHFGQAFRAFEGTTLTTSGGSHRASYLINCAGLYAEKVAQSMGMGTAYQMLPFKGIYLKWTLPTLPVRMHIYPVPDISKPFLGVHFTITADGHAKIGPTAIPAFWRENYSGWSKFSASETAETLTQEARLFFTNAFGFRDLAREEVKKYRRQYMVDCARALVKDVDPKGFTTWGPPGIRAQLMNKASKKLEMDFIIETGPNSLHMLNGISPGFTCAFPIADHVISLIP